MTSDEHKRAYKSTISSGSESPALSVPLRDEPPRAGFLCPKRQALVDRWRGSHPKGAKHDEE